MPTSARIATFLNRRQALAGLAAPLLASTAIPAFAQGYPAHTVKIVIGYPPAGATDILARLLGQKMADRLGQSVVVDNRPGAGSTLGMDIAARLPADGYNLLLSGVTSQAIASYLYASPKSDLARDFVPIALLATAPHMLIVNSEVPAKNMAEFLAWAKARNGDLNFASQGVGTLSHLESELLLQQTGLKATHVAYKGSSLAYPDLISGAVSFMFDSVAAATPLVKAGKVRALAVAASRPVPAVPDLPTVSQSGIAGYDIDNWFGLYAPRARRRMRSRCWPRPPSRCCRNRPQLTAWCRRALSSPPATPPAWPAWPPRTTRVGAR
ncbi:Bug family tripartite tricarboxylate transporter substrate binding protein [Xylophilus rhododendri]|uniref:Bug family tripartite tricarboxylate transporter substrate binding protein n=1 Tax=Xylophilus rhododendri TaxID=2697032 RepID=UPI001E345205|nr:tripartite tricarboxylate transporter substrate binding protein [Xylophilus rhododendri]